PRHHEPSIGKPGSWFCDNHGSCSCGACCFVPCLPASPDRGTMAQSNVVKGHEFHPDILKGAWMASAVAASGVRRSSSKSSTAVSITEAPLASLPTDQLREPLQKRSANEGDIMCIGVDWRAWGGGGSS